VLIILDRDGVINQYEGGYICSPDNWHPIPGSVKAIARLCNAGHRIAVATNQSGIARGYYNRDTLDAMHRKLGRLLRIAGGHIDFIAYCPHHPNEHCACRKPEPGLLQQIQRHFNLKTLAGSVMVGDSRKDLEAAAKEDCQPVLVRTGNGLDTEQALQTRPLAESAQVLVYNNLRDFTDAFLSGGDW